ncbi:MAG: tripartite tricarboxylate transporter substrate binding protein [Alphaproteobacteria bacterium]|nr:tripartite tricarboxylate transporter substrate binding protein [Alphaproteobacteria bacterium]
MAVSSRLVSVVSAKALVGAVCAGLAAGSAMAQEKFPSRPIQVIATFGAGGGADLMARQMSRLAEPILGVALPVSNVAGASGTAGLTRLLTNSPDGYTVATLIALSVSAWASNISTQKPDDFTIVAMTQDSPSMLFVPTNSPHKDIKAFLEHAKANPGKLKVATSGYGTQDDITLIYLEKLGYKTTNVPFARPAERYAAPIGGHVDAIYEEPGDVAQFVKAGQMRALVTFNDERHFAFRDVPSSKELGMQISDLPNFRTLAVPAATPADRVKVLAAAFDKVLDSPEWKKYCEDTYTCTQKLTPEQAKARVKAFYETVQSYQKRFPDMKKGTN